MRILGPKEIALKASTEIEAKALRAQLATLGVKAPAEGEPQVLRPNNVENAQVTLGDLASVAGKDGVLDLAKLERLRMSSRWLGLSKVPLKRGDPTLARAAINDFTGMLGLVRRKLNEVVAKEGWGSLVERTEILGQLAEAVTALRERTPKLRDDAILGHVTGEDVTQISTGYRDMLESYGKVADLLRQEAAELATSPKAAGYFGRVMGDLAELLLGAPLFRLSESDKLGDQQAIERATVSKRQMIELEGAHAGEIARRELAAAETARRDAERMTELERAQSTLAQMDAVHPSPDAAPRAPLLLQLFDTPGFRAFDEKERSSWIAALAGLSIPELETHTTPLVGLLKDPAFTAKSSDERKQEVNAMTRTGGLVNPDVAARVAASLELINAHARSKLTPFQFEMPGKEKIDAIVLRLPVLNAEVKAIEKESKDAIAKLERDRKDAVQALPGYADFTAHRKIVDDLKQELETAKKRFRTADYIIRDWATGRHDWKLKHGSEVGFGYFEDKNTATVVAPRVMREEPIKIAKLELKLEALEADVLKWNTFEKDQIAPIKAKGQQEIERVRSEMYKKTGVLNTERQELRTTVNNLASSAFRGAGEGWVLDRQVIIFWGRNSTFDATFTRNGYREKVDTYGKYPAVMLSQLEEGSKSLGMFELDAKKSRAEALGYLHSNLEKFATGTKDDNLGVSHNADHKSRTIFNAIITQLNRVNAAAES